MGKGIGPIEGIVMALLLYFSTDNVDGPITIMRSEKWGRVFDKRKYRGDKR